MSWQGELLHIHIAPQGSAPMREIAEARLIAGTGIEGDRYATRLGTYSQRHHIDRQATLIEYETLEALARDRNIALLPQEHRRNLTTRGVPLNHLVGQYFRVGARFTTLTGKMWSIAAWIFRQNEDSESSWWARMVPANRRCLKFWPAS